MLESIINNLSQAGWTLTSLDGEWVCATHSSNRRGLLFGFYQGLPNDFEPWIRTFADIVQWDAIVFCPEGIDSSRLKQYRFGRIQGWYWDLSLGNIFPYPPTRAREIPQWLRKLSNGESALLEDSFSSQRRIIPSVTYLLLGLNLIVFLLMTLAGGSTQDEVLIAFGAKVNTLIQAGQVWRFLTSIFIHIGLIHLLFNLYALWVLGPITEERFGHWRFFVIYILSGIGGSIASFLLSPALSAGASGAIFGLLGALLYYSFKRPTLWRSGLGMNLIIVILVNLGFGFLQPGIDNYAHLGGLLTGAVISVIVQKKNVTET